ncbi:MAG: tRNA (adenosine(37)-N6)-dimethylallyltransferase MiaA [Proteobacteria bacterium]|nr:tRNA (adenosine(37)-N6)-dimethylallyltransferase MiaA [Pseudomonadota bacterium]
MDSPAILIAGPTASGKSALALKLAEALADRGEVVIVNADSQQVYAELRVLSARPAAADEARVPHALYGHRSARAPYSVAAWRTDALSMIGEQVKHRRIPIVVGGTGLYFRALLHGIADIPEIPPATRQSVRDRLERQGPAELHEELARGDPETAARLNANDGQRIARALEVLEATGLPLSAWQRDAANGTTLACAAKFVVQVDRAKLHARIGHRFAGMIEAGALEEVAALRALKLDPGLPVMKALGVPELTAYLKGEVSLDAAIDQAQTGTRRFAKRQMTWFRNQMADWTPLDGAQQMESIIEEIFPFIRHFC